MLSNWAEMDAANFEYESSEFHAWVESAQAPAIPATERLYDQARKLGVRVFLLTGRPERERAATESNLRLRGFGGWQQPMMRAPGQTSETALTFKSDARRKIRSSGYQIVLNVGDQWSDLGGTPRAEYSVKYPDPYYFIK